MTNQTVNIQQKFDLLEEQWKPKIIAEMNNYQFKIVKLEGDFIWHNHIDTDETFMVIEGQLDIHFRDRIVTLNEGELFVIPKGEEHKPHARQETKVMLIEPRGTLNTGHEESDRTAPDDEWV